MVCTWLCYGDVETLRQCRMLRDITYFMIEMNAKHVFAQKIPFMKKDYCTFLDSNTFSQNISLRFA